MLYPQLVGKRRPLCRWGILLAVIHYKNMPIPVCWLSATGSDCRDFSRVESCKPSQVILQVMDGQMVRQATQPV